MVLQETTEGVYVLKQDELKRVQQLLESFAKQIPLAQDSGVWDSFDAVSKILDDAHDRLKDTEQLPVICLIDYENVFRDENTGLEMNPYVIRDVLSHIREMAQGRGPVIEIRLFVNMFILSPIGEVLNPILSRLGINCEHCPPAGSGQWSKDTVDTFVQRMVIESGWRLGHRYRILIASNDKDFVPAVARAQNYGHVVEWVSLRDEHTRLGEISDAIVRPDTESPQADSRTSKSIPPPKFWPSPVSYKLASEGARLKLDPHTIEGRSLIELARGAVVGSFAASIRDERGSFGFHLAVTVVGRSAEHANINISEEEKKILVELLIRKGVFSRQGPRYAVNTSHPFANKALRLSSGFLTRVATDCGVALTDLFEVRRTDPVAAKQVTNRPKNPPPTANIAPDTPVEQVRIAALSQLKTLGLNDLEQRHHRQLIGSIVQKTGIDRPQVGNYLKALVESGSLSQIGRHYFPAKVGENILTKIAHAAAQELRRASGRSLKDREYRQIAPGILRRTMAEGYSQELIQHSIQQLVVDGVLVTRKPSPHRAPCYFLPEEEEAESA